MGDVDLAAFVKKAIFSASSESDGVKTLFLDGFNNPGFSGGLVAFWDGRNKAHICGVISGCHFEMQKVISGDEEELGQFIRANLRAVLRLDRMEGKRTGGV